MAFTEQEIEEFKTEARELLENGERNLLAMAESSTPQACFDSVFRSFHNLKGAAGMMEMLELQRHTHELETILMTFKEQPRIPKIYVDLFLRGIDGARAILNGETIVFDFSVTGEQPSAVVSPALPPVMQAHEMSLSGPSGGGDNSAPLPNFAVNILPHFQTAPLQQTRKVTPIPGSADFVTEAEEIIEHISEKLRLFQSGVVSNDLINECYRDTHSLKGAAYLFGFIDIGDVAHMVESALEPVRKNSSTLSKSLIDAIYKAVECVELSLSSWRTKTENPHIRTMVNLIAILLQSAPPRSMFADAAGSAPDANLPKAASVPASPVPLTVDRSVEPVTPAPGPTQLSAAGASAAEPATTSIRVPVSLLDNLMILMGEMVLVRNQVLQFANLTEDLGFATLSQRLNVVTNEIQADMMKTRMQPIGGILNKFHRVVRDLASELNKDMTLTLTGSETELDKSLLEAIKDPLTHIVRNSCDHGIETRVRRLAAGKPEVGAISVKAYHEGGQVIIEVTDDGKGLDRQMLLKKGLERGLITEAQSLRMSDKEVFNLIFAPGFSTAEKITNVSGRGVGMDVVKTNIEKIGGAVDISSQLGVGTTMRLRIPLTLAIVPALMVRSEQGTFAIPQTKLLELIRVDQNSENHLESLQGANVFRLRGQLLPIIDLNCILSNKPRTKRTDAVLNVVVLSAEGQSFGLIVDAIDDTADIVVKPLSQFLKPLQVYSGATLLGDGSVALILDVQGLAKMAALNSDAGVTESERLLREKNTKDGSEVQDFLLIRAASPTKHAVLLSYVNRLEEFKSTDVEMSGRQRVVRYRQSILPLVSINEGLGYSKLKALDSHVIHVIHVVVVERGGRLYGLEVDEILDTLSTSATTDTTTVTDVGVIGNLATEQEVIVVVDPYAIISSVLPQSQSMNIPKIVAQTRPVHLASRASSGVTRVLIADDSVFFQKLIRGTLENAGFDVQCAIDGAQAMEILSRTKTPFDLIISDIEMPHMNGFEFAAAVRGNADHRYTPMIALSSKHDRKMVEQAAKVGFDNYLEKLNAEVLLKAIGDLTARSIEEKSA